MEITEIVLLAAGGIIFILSFLLPDKKGEAKEQSKELVRDEIADMVSREMEGVREQVDGVVEEAVTYAMEKTERSLERLSNEKIMAVNEYSDTVLTEIHKNHQEAMFLYDMLNSKHDNLKNTVSEVNRTVKEVEERLGGFQEKMDGFQEKLGGFQEKPGGFQEMTGIARLSAASIPQSFTPSASVPSASVPSASVPSASVPAADRVSFLQERAADGQNNNMKILELYRQGKSKVAIAKELGLGVGEVKLVIDLFRNQ